MFNSSDGSLPEVTIPDGRVLSYSTAHGISSDPSQLSIDYSHQYYPLPTGIYTCRKTDSNDVTIELSVGIYRSGPLR